MSTIYRKTAAGQAELASRARTLPPHLRTALIMVDGRRTDDDLRQLLAQQADETLEVLTRQGLIETLSVTASVAPPPPKAPPSNIDFRALRRDAVRAINDQLGPEAEALALKMERATSLAELRPLIGQAVSLIGHARGGSAAGQFASRFVEGVRG